MSCQQNPDISPEAIQIHPQCNGKEALPHRLLLRAAHAFRPGKAITCQAKKKE